jgi:hypothetical protein
MHIEYGSEEARLLRQLLADAHKQIRGLQAQVDQLAAALLLLTLNDRRRATGAYAEGSGERERRRESAPTISPEAERRGRGRHGAAVTQSD